MTRDSFRSTCSLFNSYGESSHHLTVDFAIAWFEAAFLNRYCNVDSCTSSNFSSCYRFNSITSCVRFHVTSFWNSINYDMSYCGFDREVIDVLDQTLRTKYCFTDFVLSTCVSWSQRKIYQQMMSWSCRKNSTKHFILFSEHIDFTTIWSNHFADLHSQCEFRSFSNGFVDSTFIEYVVH